MKRIEEFHNSANQDVKTFNQIFKFTPILEFDDSLEVEILEPVNADRRLIKVGDKFIKLSLIQPKYGRSISKDSRQAIFLEHKVCTKCNRYLPLEAFSPHKKSKGGCRAACKKCCVKIVTACNLKKKQTKLK
jgi:hypothetical protein